MITHRRSNPSALLFALSLILSACGPVTAPQPESSSPPAITATTVIPYLEPITPENVDRLEQIDKWGMGAVDAFAASPDQRTVALYVGEKIELYDTKTLDLTETIPAGKHTSQSDLYHPAWKPLTFAPDGRTLAFAGDAGIQVWSLSTNERLRSFSSVIPGWEVVHLDFSPNGERMLVVTLGGSARCDGRDMNFALYDLQGHLLFDRYYCEAYSETAYRLTTDGKALFLFSSIMSGIRPAEAFLVDAGTGALLASSHASFEGTGVPAQELLYDISPDGKILAYATYGGRTVVTKLVDFETKAVLATTDNYIEFFVENGQVRWRTQEAAPPPAELVFGGCSVENSHPLDYYQLAALGTTSAVLVVSHFGQIGSVELWNLLTCRFSKTLSFPAAQQAVFSPDGRWLAASDGYNAYVWKARTGQPHLTIPGKPSETPVDLIQFNADGTRLLAGPLGRDYILPDQPYRKYVISIYEVETGKLLREIEPETEFLYRIDATPDRDIVLAQDSAGLHFWNIETGRLLADLPAGPFVFDPKGHEIWLVPQQHNDGKTSRTLFLSDYQTGQTVREVATVQSPWVRGLYLDAGAHKVLAHLFLGQGFDKGDAVSIFDAETGQALLSYSLPWQNYDLTAQADLFATYGSDGYVHLWNYEEDTPYLTVLGERTNRPAEGGDAYAPPIFLKASLFDEHLLMTRNDSVRFWDTADGRLLAELSPSYEIADIDFSPDRTLIAVTGRDGLIHLWGVRK